MANLEVAELHYRFVSRNPYDRFTNAVPLVTSVPDFDLTLNSGELTATPTTPFAAVEDARAHLEPVLRAWEASARLDAAQRDISFEFSHADLIDRSGTGGIVVSPPPMHLRFALSGAMVAIDNKTYPPPPTAFAADPVLMDVMDRLRQVDAGSMPRATAANWVLTRLETAYGTGKGSDVRKTTASAVNVHLDVLNTIGRLAAQNDPDEGRKAKGPQQPFTPAEREWLREVIVLLARQVGVRNSGATPPRRTMADLPTI